jgi:dipeptidyl aminopeptidase/acylaminoacyl peptidase
VVVRRGSDGRVTDVTPAPFSTRSRVHEYGGGAYAVRRGIVCFTNFADQQVYAQERGGDPRPLTASPAMRFADFAFDPERGRVVCVCEDHGSNGAEPRSSLVAVRLAGGAVETLVAGHDFHASPRLSPDRRRMAWLTWDHPRMPWDGSQLWVAEIAADGSVTEPVCVAGGERESIFQPEWSPDGRLSFASDRTGWWNLYLWSPGSEVVPICSMEAEFGAAQWVFGQSTHAFSSPSRIVCAWADRGVWRLGTLTPRAGARAAPFDLPFTDFSSVRASANRAVFVAAGPANGAAIVSMDAEHGAFRVLRRASESALEDGYVSTGETFSFPTSGEATAHAFFYPPRNRDFRAPEGEKPPLLVMSHGGPTAASTNSLSLKVQYWTSRGVAVLDVNYRGSTGHGRAYRQALEGRWGVVDVDDCVAGAAALVAAGRVDGERLAITGGSAGGYTTLCALTFRDAFKAGASYYGISDLEALARDTHKFESHYEESLVGPWPESRDLYRERSPIHFAERLSCPVIFFQGLDDRVVPPSQTEGMVAALRARGLQCAYLAFEGEGHGFRRAETIERCLEAELYFYSRVFGFELADPVEPVPIA